MIVITDRNKCSGCGACVQICPKNCISFQSDNEGFLYPFVDQTECINCNLCVKVCQYQSDSEIETETIKPLNVYAAFNKDNSIRNESSSGGIFTLLAEYILDKGGYVFGAAFDNDWSVKHISINKKEDLYRLRGSKYVQSRTENTYKEVLSYLKEDIWVLYSGTPCQVLGLKKFLKKDYPKLVTVDVVCHGVPSPLVWKRYLSEITGNTQIKNITFRNKRYGWRNFTLLIETNKKTYSYSIETNMSPYMNGFLKDLYLRPSCYNCISKNFKCKSDISIADYWWIRNVAPEMDDNKGCSQIFINTHKGQDIFGCLDLYKKETYSDNDIREAYIFSGAVSNSAIYNKRRSQFFKDFDNGKLINLIIKLTKPTLKEYAYIKIRDIGRKNLRLLNIYKKHIKPLLIKDNK